MLIHKQLKEQALSDLSQKMLFVAGPRQVGKTTFSHSLRPQEEFQYLNWAINHDRSKILNQELDDTKLIIFDEIHKYRKWRNYLKGVYDAMKTGSLPLREILVTGSARLDYYRFGGDSLQGRYHFLRMLPLSLREIGGESRNDLLSLFTYGGFPEPFLRQSETETLRWSNEYRSRLIHDDVRDLEQVQDIGSLELLAGRLPRQVGSLLSINALREELQVSHRTVDKWIKVLERLYALFRLAPLGGSRLRALKKSQKHYYYDWTAVRDEGARFENLVAVHLLKHACWQLDTGGREMELRYFRDVDGREVDFVVTESGEPCLLVECKLGDQEIGQPLRYLKLKYPKARAFQVHLRGQKDYLTLEGIRHCPADVLLKELSA